MSRASALTAELRAQEEKVMTDRFEEEHPRLSAVLHVLGGLAAAAAVMYLVLILYVLIW